MVQGVQITDHLIDLANKSAELTIFNNELLPRLEKLLPEEDISQPISKLISTKKLFEKKKASVEMTLLKDKLSRIKEEIGAIEQRYYIMYTVVKNIFGSTKPICSSIDQTDAASLGFWSCMESADPALWDVMPLFDYGPYHPEYLEGEWEDFADSKHYWLIDGYTDALLLKHLEELAIKATVEIENKFDVTTSTNIRRTVEAELKHLTMVWDNAKRPMFQSDVYNRIVSLIVDMVITEKTIEPERKIPPLFGAPKQVLLASLARLHDIIYDTGGKSLRRREHWYNSIINTFEDFESYNEETIKKRFKTYIDKRNIEDDIAKLLTQ